MFEVQTRLSYGWENCWTESDPELNAEYPQTFDTHDEAMTAIYEFFADLSRAGMAQEYDLSDYRVRPLQQPPDEGELHHGTR